MGCVMMRVCDLDTCPVGVATQNPELRKNFKGKPEYVMNFMKFIAEELREYMAALGVRKPLMNWLEEQIYLPQRKVRILFTENLT
jgi:glutamate synthase domain-containing protein 2